MHTPHQKCPLYGLLYICHDHMAWPLDCENSSECALKNYLPVDRQTETFRLTFPVVKIPPPPLLFIFYVLHATPEEMNNDCTLKNVQWIKNLFCYIIGSIICWEWWSCIRFEAFHLDYRTSGALIPRHLWSLIIKSRDWQGLLQSENTLSIRDTALKTQ